MKSRSNLRTAVALAVTTAVILAGVWLVQSPPWRNQGADPTGVSSVTVNVPAGQAAPAVGSAAADFTATTIAGEPVTLSELRGQPVWLVFGATWCTNCRAEAPDVDAVAQAFDGRVRVISVYVGEDAATVKGFADKLKLTTPQIADTSDKISGTYAVLGIPAHFFIDSDGMISQITVGSVTRQAATDVLSALAG